MRTNRPLTLIMTLVSGLLWHRVALGLNPQKALAQYIHDVWWMEDGLP